MVKNVNNKIRGGDTMKIEGINRVILVVKDVEKTAKYYSELFGVSFQDLSGEGIKCYFGKWKVKGEPSAILIDFKNYVKQKDNIKKVVWEDYKIDSLKAGWDYEEPMVWSYAAGRLIDKIVSNYRSHKASVHCHEWMAGFALLYLKKKNPKVGTVFTTHATMLGRSMAGNNMDLYNINI